MDEGQNNSLANRAQLALCRHDDIWVAPREQIAQLSRILALKGRQKDIIPVLSAATDVPSNDTTCDWRTLLKGYLLR